MPWISQKALDMQASCMSFEHCFFLTPIMFTMFSEPFVKLVLMQWQCGSNWAHFRVDK